MTHAGIWAAIDRVAKDMKLSRSGLARGCGLDSTAFNKSKRMTRYGKPRWPNMGTVSKVIAFAGLSDKEFFSYCEIV